MWTKYEHNRDYGSGARIRSEYSINIIIISVVDNNGNDDDEEVITVGHIERQ